MNTAEHLPNLDLSLYGLSAERGFLAAFDPAAVRLPEALALIEAAARDLPQVLPTGRVRAHLDALPEPDLAALCPALDEPQQRMAMLRYAFLVQAYVWGEAEPPMDLPANLARPIWHLAAALGQQPLLPYSSYALDNWAKFDAGAGFTLDNLHTLQGFLGGQDEAWFILIHVAIEAAAGSMLAGIPDLVAAAHCRDSTGLGAGLEAMVAGWARVNEIFDRMPERCDPYVYFHRVRPWIHGWKDNPALGAGLVYAGVEATGGASQAFRGQTGSQSSIVPTMDALYGIEHADDPMRRFLDELHQYRPPAHRRFIEDVRATSTLRTAVADSGRPALKALYNSCLEGLSQFRNRHLEYAARYINCQARGARGNATDVGTGGTPFMQYLKKHRVETDAFLLD